MGKERPGERHTGDGRPFMEGRLRETLGRALHGHRGPGVDPGDAESQAPAILVGGAVGVPFGAPIVDRTGQVALVVVTVGRGLGVSGVTLRARREKVGGESPGAMRAMGGVGHPGAVMDAVGVVEPRACHGPRHHNRGPEGQQASA